MKMKRGKKMNGENNKDAMKTGRLHSVDLNKITVRPTVRHRRTPFYRNAEKSSPPYPDYCFIGLLVLINQYSNKTIRQQSNKPTNQQINNSKFIYLNIYLLGD